jgi:hypothetical protein
MFPGRGLASVLPIQYPNQTDLPPLHRDMPEEQQVAQGTPEPLVNIYLVIQAGNKQLTGSLLTPHKLPQPLDRAQPQQAWARASFLQPR